jgi:hypothetical protein
MTEPANSTPLPKTYEEIHKQALDRRGRPAKSDIGIPITDENPEYSKLLNEVVTLRWKCGDQADALKRAQERGDKLHELHGQLMRMIGHWEQQSDALKIARAALEGMVRYSGMRETWQDDNPEYVTAARDAIGVNDAALDYLGFEITEKNDE